ncbi:hypothetical protein [Burkholderia sp. Ac-20379]
MAWRAMRRQELDGGGVAPGHRVIDAVEAEPADDASSPGRR